MDNVIKQYTIKNYFGTQQFWIVRSDGNFATHKSFATREEAKAYAESMPIENFA